VHNRVRRRGRTGRAPPYNHSSFGGLSVSINPEVLAELAHVSEAEATRLKDERVIGDTLGVLTG